MLAIVCVDSLKSSRIERFAVLVECQVRTDIVFLVWIDAPQMADTFAVLGVLTDGEVNEPVVYDRCGDQIVASASATKDPLGIF